MNNLNQFSDSQLYTICKKWGREALAARRRFAGLLPEVLRREMESREGDGGLARGLTGRREMESWGGDAEPAGLRQAKFKDGKPVQRQMEITDGAIGWQKSASVIAESDQQKITAKIVHSPGPSLPLPQQPPSKSWLGKRGYTCLYEFAARLAGMSRDQVNRVLQLDKRFAALPILHGALINGDVSVNKLARIASVATLENQRELLNRAEKLSKAALEIYIKEYRIKCGMDLRGAVEAEAVAGKGDARNGTQFMTDDSRQKMKMVSMVVGRAGESTLPNEQSAGMNMARAGISAVTDEQNTGINVESASQGVGQTVVSLFKPDVLNKPSLDVLTAEGGSSTTARAGSVPGHNFGYTETKTHGLQLDTDVEKELMELQEKGIDVNDFLRKCLEQRKLEIQEEMEKLGREQLQVRLEKHIIGKPASRYMQAKIKRIIRAYYGHVCSAAGCTKPAAHIHHQKPFALFGSHDPRHLRPLCKEHHELAHVGELINALLV